MPEIATWPRRIAALFVDWIASTLVTIGLVGLGTYLQDPSSGWFVLGVFAAETALLTTLAGGSFGQLATGLRVLTTEGGPVPLLLSLARTLLICLVVPPLVFRSADGRGLHDLWTGTAAYRRPLPGPATRPGG